MFAFPERDDCVAEALPAPVIWCSFFSEGSRHRVKPEDKLCRSHALVVLAPIAAGISLVHAAFFGITIVALMECGAGEHLGCDNSRESQRQRDFFHHCSISSSQSRNGF